jgi:hypothetical protein
MKLSPKVKAGEAYPAHAVEEAIRLASANATAVVERIGAKAGILTASQFARDARFKNLITRKTLA